MGKETKIFDEYSTFNNKEKDEEHSTQNAFFSPDNKYAVQTIENISRTCDPIKKSCTTLHSPPTLLVTSLNGETVLKKEGMSVLGWLNSTTLAVKDNVKYTEGRYDWDFIENSSGIAALNVETGEKNIILNEDFDQGWVINNSSN